MSSFEIFQTLTSNVWIYGGTFLLVLSLLVFIHEWGHYIVARWCGVKVDVFSIGFGREIYGFNDKSGTRWKISMIPLGGYVKMFGDVDPASVQKAEDVEDEETGELRPLDEDELRSAFYAKSVWQRALIVFAGPAINYIFAIIVLTGLFTFNGQPVTPPVTTAIVAESSADKAGFHPHDYVLAIDGAPIRSFEDIRREMMISLDRRRVFDVQRDGEIIELVATPEKIETEDKFGFKQSRGLLGVISPRYAIDIKNILKLDGRDFEGNPDGLRKAILANMGREMSVEVKEGDDARSYTIRPVEQQNPGLGDTQSDDYNILYIADQDGRIFVQYNVLEAFAKSIEESVNITVSTIEAISQMITGTRSATELGGIIRIGALAGDMAQQGIIALVLFMALLSINLGLINLFPIPLLDGGHLVFYAFEAVRGKPVSDRVQEYAFRLGLAFLVGVMVFANLNDIMQLIL